MPKTKLTVQGIKGLPTPDSGRTDYQDTELPGLILRVSSTGRKAYSVSYWKDGKRPRVTIGITEDSPKRGPGATDPERLSLADAREKATEVLRDARLGLDPAAKKREEREAVTFKALARKYVTLHAKRKKAPKGARADERRVEETLIPRWGHMKAGDIRKRDVVELLDEYAEDGHYCAADRMKALVSVIFSFGIKRDEPGLESNPAFGIDAYYTGGGRDRVLSDDEIATVLPLFDKEGLAGLGFRLLLLTGQRPKEVFGMQWSEIEGDAWTLPGERAKNGRPNLVPLSPQAREVLRAAKAYDDDSGYVFPSPTRKDMAFTNYQEQARNVRGSKEVEEDFWIYDLRATCMTGLQRLGVPGRVISAVANHAPSGVTEQHYAFHDFADEKREAMSAWGRHVAKLDPATKGKVVELQGRGA